MPSSMLGLSWRKNESQMVLCGSLAMKFPIFVRADKGLSGWSSEFFSPTCQIVCGLGGKKGNEVCEAESRKMRMSFCIVQTMDSVKSCVYCSFFHLFPRLCVFVSFIYPLFTSLKSEIRKKVVFAYHDSRAATRSHLFLCCSGFF